ncbi:MAG: hypothetical protein JJT78_11530 [Leptospira sp.]|nr:hypothetical protein [Leptospira sp.]
MWSSILSYNFLILSIILLIPVCIIFLVRKDLRIVMIRMGLIGIPFAFTENLFYPDYWEPKSLGNLIERWGFGLEDFLFVFGLACLTATIYPAIFQKKLEPLEKFSDVFSSSESPARIFSIIGLFFFIVFLMVLVLVVSKIPMIYGSFVIMIGMGIIMLWFRRDLLIPGLLGGISTTIVYTIICLFLLAIYPGIFQFTWHTEKFMNIYLLSVPLEEILYGFSAGFSGTIFYPSLFRLRFILNH